MLKKILCFTVSPSLATGTVNKTVNESDEVTLHCAATGNPVPRITWIKDGKPVAKGDTLRFTALRNYSGIYWCLADNGLNITVKARTYLDVQCKYLISIKSTGIYREVCRCNRSIQETIRD